MQDSDTRPVGVLDSGFGGLSVVRALRRVLPAESLAFAADNKGAPWGSRATDYIRERTFALVEALLTRDIKALVVACNTATAVCVDELRARYAMPIVGIEPAVRPAAALTKSGVVVVLATQATLASERYLELKRRFAQGVRVIDSQGVGLVECVEAGDLTGPAAREAVTRALEAPLRAGADTVVLGCTHYPFLEPLMQSVAGPGVTFIDPAPAVAQELARRLAAQSLLAAPDATPVLAYYSSGPNAAREAVIRRLVGPEAKLLSL